MSKLAKDGASVPLSIWRGFFALKERQLFLPFIGFFSIYLIYGLFLSKTFIPPISGLYALSLGTAIIDLALASAGFLIVTLISTFFGGLIIDFYANKNERIWDGLSYVIKRFPTLFIVVLVTGVSIILGFALFVLPGAFLGVKFMFAQQEVMVHEKGAIESIKSSYKSSKGKFWSRFSLLAVIVLISIAAYAFSSIFSSTNNVLSYIGTQLILPVNVLLSFILAYIAVFGQVAVTDYFLQRIVRTKKTYK
ncbi:MAG: hypothetical protein M1348_02950 [Candidatus Parvarchaeota archaeon]|jgi:hypothetical protein|nr:hypothetical protein [Candidatus Parvarchaeota archaeon]MCL5101543.1 hypothetical protein [Candidatus Parvarchaeota archaeon]